jgi:hypothetical protein
MTSKHLFSDLQSDNSNNNNNNNNSKMEICTQVKVATADQHAAAAAAGAATNTATTLSRRRHHKDTLAQLSRQIVRKSHKHLMSWRRLRRRVSALHCKLNAKWPLPALPFVRFVKQRRGELEALMGAVSVAEEATDKSATAAAAADADDEVAGDAVMKQCRQEWRSMTPIQRNAYKANTADSLQLQPPPPASAIMQNNAFWRNGVQIARLMRVLRRAEVAAAAALLIDAPAATLTAIGNGAKDNMQQPTAVGAAASGVMGDNDFML